MAVLRLFAAAREAAGTGRATVQGATVADVLEAARSRFGDRFGEVLDGSRVWLNGEPAAMTDPAGEDDEVAVLPPVSGGSEAEPPGDRGGDGKAGRGRAAGAPRPQPRWAAPARPTVDRRLGAGPAAVGTRTAPAGGSAAAAAPAEIRAELPLDPAVAPVARPRLTVVHDVAGPRVRLGMLWFTAAMAALALGHVALGLFLAGAAALAADQLLRLRAGDGVLTGPVAFRDWQTLPMRLPVALAAGSLPLAAVAGVRTVGAALPAVVLVVLAYRLLTPGPTSAVLDIAHTVTFAMAAGLAAAAPVLAYGFGPGAAFVLILLVSAYDAGDFIVGSGAGNVWEGPAAGIAAVLVAAFAVAVLALEPIGGDLVLPALAVCLLAPLGPPAASVLIGDGRTRAGFVRRLDSLLIVGPVWIWVVAAMLG